MAFEISYTEEAENDLARILSWLLYERKAGEAGLRWYVGLQEAISTLREMPERCTVAPESRSLRFEMRQLLYGRRPRVYRVLLVIEAKTVYVIAIRRPYEESYSLQ